MVLKWRKLVAPYQQKQPHGRRLSSLFHKVMHSEEDQITNFGPLPHGDMSVSPQTTEIMVGWIPTETLAWTLDPKSNPIPTQEPFWNRSIPTYHPTDQQQKLTLFASMNRDLRFALHTLLSQDYTYITSDTSK